MMELDIDYSSEEKKIVQDLKERGLLGRRGKHKNMIRSEAQ
jgi:hypothetical protein